MTLNKPTMVKPRQALLTIGNTLVVFAVSANDNQQPVELATQIVYAPVLVNQEVGLTTTQTPFHQTQNTLSIDFLDRFNANSVVNLSDYVPGVQASRNGAGMGEDYSIRGFPLGGRLLLDGVLDNQSYYVRDPATYEQVDFIKGHNSAWYGAGVPGGSVNFIAKRPQYQPSTSVTAGLGSDDYQALVVDSTGPLAPHSAWAYRTVLAARHLNSDKQNVDSSPVTLLNSVAWQGESTELTGSWEYSRQNYPYDFDNVYAQGSPVYDVSYVHPASFAKSEYHRFELQSDTQLASNLRLEGIYRRITGQREEKRIGFWFMADEDSPLPGYYREVDENFTQNTGHLSLHYDYALGGLRHETAVGLAYHETQSTYDDAVSSYDFSLNIYQPDFDVSLPSQDQLTPLSGNIDWQESALLMSQKSQLTDTLDLSLGARYTDYRLTNVSGNSSTSEADNRALSYSGGLAWALDDQLTLRASYSQSWLANQGQDKNANYFDPSRGVQHELGLNWQPTPSATLDMALFNIRQNNLLVRDLEIAERYVLAGEKTVKGAEANLSIELNDQWQATAATTYMEARLEKTNDANEGNRFPSVPTHQHSLMLHYQPISQLTLTPGVVYQGSRPGDRANSFYVDSYTRYDLSAHWQAMPDLSIQASIQNLTDIDYVTSSAADDFLRFGDPRTLRISATKQF
ncbi:TonB-dependent siderophore receptor [Vreelandella titanicae]|uniref:TonB-dependent siderophore receptor n=1 Tax=Vreelandella titanicae TaxID=664683 RepID=UPI0030B8A5D2|nr:TonB-dependent receptor [Halomonas titanicae]